MTQGAIAESPALGVLDPIAWEHAQDEWFAEQFENWTTKRKEVTPSGWAEAKRYLSKSLTSLPGPFRFEVSPYIREIVDCFDMRSPIRHVSVMKGAQVCATVGILENVIGYCIDHVRTAPMQLVTADGEMAKLRIETNITPMLQESGLIDQIRSSDTKRTRKTGFTDKKMEWEGGGFLLPTGSQNPNKFRSTSVQILLRDEVDGWPDVVGKDGDPMKLSEARTDGYTPSRKILDLSTPNLKGLSKIEKQFKLGDQRYYFVNCVKCGFSQTLRWSRTHKDGSKTGIVWEMENGRLVPDSVRYLCEECHHPHTNDDKVRLLDPAHGAHWESTAEPSSPDRRSYHINALYSPVGMQTWAGCVHKWIEAWDDEADRMKDVKELQVFYNNVLGEPFEQRARKLHFNNVSPHRREAYALGEVPNKLAESACGGPIVVLTCAVDVHKDNLACAVMGWTKDRRVFVIDYWRFEGDVENLEDEDTWGRLRKLLEGKEYVADDGKRYRIAITLVDSGYNANDVYSFCAEYEQAVFPIKGKDRPKGPLKQFTEFSTSLGGRCFSIVVDFYKDRWGAALRMTWSGQGRQAANQFNAPRDITDAQLKELTTEVKREKVDKETGVVVGYEWHRRGNAANELWDLLVYNNAALDLVAWDLCLGQLHMDDVDWTAFFDLAQDRHPFFETA